MSFNQRQLAQHYTGMRLAGAAGRVYHERSELKEGSGAYYRKTKRSGIIACTEKFGREFPEIIDDVRFTTKHP